jgi:hypothetical protein
VTATASPSRVRPGEVVTITPAEEITRACADIVTAQRSDGGTPPAGQLYFGEWRPAHDATTMTVPDCAGTTSAGALSIVIPLLMPAGAYDLCLGDVGDTRGCAPLTVLDGGGPLIDCTAQPTAPPTLVDGTAPGPMPTEITATFVRWGADGAPNAVRQLLQPLDPSWLDEALADGRAIVDDRYQAAAIPVGDPPISEITIYVRNTADGCLLAYNVGPGLMTDEASALARRWVDSLGSGVVGVPAQPAIGVEYFGRRTGPEPPNFAFDRIGPDGSVEATLTDAEIAALTAPDALPDGSTLVLDGEAPSGRCVNQPLRSSGGSADAVLAVLPDARSLLVTSTGVVLAGRDVCGAGRWGDPGTRWELVAVDLASADPTPRVLLQRESDEGSIMYDDGTVVYAVGEMYLAGASPDGRYVSVIDWFHTERAKWHLLDLQGPDGFMELVSACPIAGDIVGQPRFLDDGVVVVARLCATARAEDASAMEPSGDGDVHVEAVDLSSPGPINALLWSVSRPGLGTNSYSRVVQLDAMRGPDGDIWAIVTGNGGVEQDSESLVLHGTEVTDISRPGYHSFAFSPALLL